MHHFVGLIQNSRILGQSFSESKYILVKESIDGLSETFFSGISPLRPQWPDINFLPHWSWHSLKLCLCYFLVLLVLKSLMSTRVPLFDFLLILLQQSVNLDRTLGLRNIVADKNLCDASTFWRLFWTLIGSFRLNKYCHQEEPRIVFKKVAASHKL